MVIFLLYDTVIAPPVYVPISLYITLMSIKLPILGGLEGMNLLQLFIL